MVNKTRIAALLLLPVIILPVAGCAGNKAKTDTAYVARDVNTLYSEAKERLDRGRYDEAAIFFDEVERQHPYSVWARRAQLMSAFSYYMAQKYTDAISSATRLVSSTRCRPISCGVCSGQATLRASSLVFISGVAAISRILALSFSTMSGGVPAGAQIEYQLGT